MPPLAPSQKALVTQFMSITGVPEKSSQKLLKASGWKLEQACERRKRRQDTSITAIFIAMDEWRDPRIRNAFDRILNIIIVRIKHLQNVCPNCVIDNSAFSRSGIRHQWDIKFKIGKTLQQYGLKSRDLFATQWSIMRVKEGGFIPPYNAHNRFNIFHTALYVRSGNCNNRMDGEILPPAPPADSPTPLQACRDLLTLLSPQSRDMDKAKRLQRFKPSHRFQSSSVRTFSSCIFPSYPTGRDFDRSEFLNDSDGFLSKLDPKVLFELRNPIVLNATVPRNLFTAPYRQWITTGCLPPILGRELYEEFKASGERHYLKFFDWLEMHRGDILADYPSLRSYFGSNGIAPIMAKEKDVLSRLFEKYRDPKIDEIDSISVDGTMRYLADLGINMETAEFLVPLEIVQAPALGEITRDGFVDGWKNITGIVPDTIAKQKAYATGQIKLMKTDVTLFKRVYRHAFICSKEKTQKALPLENALVYWEMLFGPSGRHWVTASTNWVEMWLEFLNAKWTKSVNKDMWNQTFEFYQKSLQDETLSFWSEDGAWPGVIDEFVAYAKQKRQEVPESMETD